MLNTELADRLYNILDYYELSDTDATPGSIAADIERSPEAIIEYLVTIIEDLQA